MEKILLIDPDLSNQSIIKLVIKEAFPGAILITQNSSADLMLSIPEEPDLILINLLSPGMDAYEVCCRLKREQETKNIPLVCLTRREDDQKRRFEAVDAGADAFLYFPLDKVEITLQLRTMLKLKQAAPFSTPGGQHFEDKKIKKGKKYRRIFENIQDVYYEASVDGIIIEMSPSVEVISKGQYHRNDLIGSPIHSYYANPDDRETMLTHLYKNGRISDYELPILNKDGSIIPCTISAKLCVDEAGSPEKVVGILHDITQRKLAEEKLIESQLKYQLVFENSGTVNSIFDTECRLVLQNEKSVRFLGNDNHSFLGKSALEIFGPSTGQNITERMQRVIATLIPEEFETYFELASGKRWFHSIYQPIIDRKNQIQGLQIISQDITAQKQTELALIESETRFRTLSENSLTGIYTIYNNRLQYVNPALAEIFGYTQDELIGANPLILIHPDDRMLVSENILSRTEGEIPSLKYEFRGLKKNGETNFLLVLGGISVINKHPILVGNILDITDRKKGEILLQTSQKQISEILESITDGFVAFDAQMNYTYINSRGAALFNLTPKDLIGKNYWSEFPEAKGTPFAKNYQDALETKKTVIFEEYYQPWDRWFENRIYPTPEGISVYYSETTDRKRIERSLDESNELNNTLLRTIPFGMDIVDEEGTILFMSENLEKSFGKNTTGQKCWQLYRDDQSQCTSCPLLKSIAVGETRVHESSGVIGGKNFEISHTGLMYQGKKAILEIFQDITQKKEIEKKVNLLAQSLESISECVTITDLDDKIIYVNESLLHTYQYTKEEIIGNHINILRTPGDHGKHAMDILPKTMEGGWRGEITNVKKDGTLFPILLSTSVIRDEHEQPIALIGVAMDITEMSRNRKELVTAKEQAEEINRLKSAFLGNMSHEIRTPMNAIIGFSDLIAGADEEDKNSYAEIIIKSSTQLLALIDDVILISRLQSEKMPVYETEFYPAEVVMDIYSMFNHPDMHNGLEINSKLPEDYRSLVIKSDANKVKQILTNLTSNAVKYTFEGSIEIGFKLQSGHIEFYVKDTGIGISEKEQFQIFETFYRGEQALSAAIRGTGLGLNIAKELVNVIGGTIGVESVVNKGSRFYFTVPVTEMKLKNPENQHHIINTNKSVNHTILIVDDEPINSHYLETILKGIFKRIDHAPNGKEAINMVSQNKYSLILMDLKMPVMGGIEATKILREKFPEIPIIAQTAYSLPEERTTAMAAGFDDFISKPIKKEELINMMNKYSVNFK